PRIVAHEAGRLVAFVKHVFRAAGEYQSGSPAVLRIADSNLMISGAGARRPMSAFLYVYVSDVDEAFRRAVEAGARVLEEPSQMPYGDRRCMIEDEWGNTWQIASRVRNRR